MKLVPVSCREHGGIFRVPKRPGRRPVRCNKNRPCSKSSGQDSTQDKPVLPPGKRDLRTRTVAPGKVTTRRVPTVPEIINFNPATVEKELRAERRLRLAEKKAASEPIQVPENKSLVLAMKAKQDLLAQDWEVVGEAWSAVEPLAPGYEAQESVDYAALTATRDEEILTLTWRNGEKILQEYSIWDNGNMSKNVPAKGAPTPNSKLSFEPDELSDVELLRAINGQKVKWVNRISGGEESAVIDAKQVQIQHTYTGGTADENPGDRMIKFVDKGRGYRAFYVTQLCAVESP